MKTISTRGQELMSDLIAWEMGWSNVEPRPLLRELSFMDLSVLAVNFEAFPGGSEFICEAVAALLEVEVLYRQGKLHTDWTLTQDAPWWKLSYVPVGSPDDVVVRYVKRFCDNFPS